MRQKFSLIQRFAGFTAQQPMRFAVSVPQQLTHQLVRFAASTTQRPTQPALCTPLARITANMNRQPMSPALSYLKLSAHPFNSFSLTRTEKTFPSFKSAPAQDGANSLFVFPMPLPPEVASGIIVLPARSYCSKNVLIIVGATYHQIGNAT